MSRKAARIAGAQGGVLRCVAALGRQRITYARAALTQSSDAHSSARARRSAFSLQPLTEPPFFSMNFLSFFTDHDGSTVAPTPLYRG